MKTPLLKLTPFLRKSLTLLLFLCLVGGLIANRQDMRLKRSGWSGRDNDLYHLPSPQNLQRLSVGYRGVLADLVWIRALLYAGEHFSDKIGSIRWLPQYFEAVRALDPKYRFAYEWAATLNIYNRRTPTRRDMVESLRILDLGREQFPNDHYFPYSIAMAYIFEINLTRRDHQQLRQDYKAFCKKPVPSALSRDQLIRQTRSCMKRIGARYLMEAASKPNAPPYIGVQAAGLMRRNHTNNQMICNYLMDLLWRANQAESVRKIRERLSLYCGSKKTKESICREKQFTAQWQKQADYMPRVVFGHLVQREYFRQLEPFSPLKPPQDPCVTRP
ncbi:MAG: hypothetical protein H6728_07130 [Myxococcales bacterium]|nr:hypothetical protein [Myxococcales bacterium]